MMSGIYLLVGKTVILCGGVLVIAAILYLTALAINRSLWFFVESMGGLKVFNEFIKFVNDAKDKGEIK